jgi:hypothetical protein
MMRKNKPKYLLLMTKKKYFFGKMILKKHFEEILQQMTQKK